MKKTLKILIGVLIANLVCAWLYWLSSEPWILCGSLCAVFVLATTVGGLISALVVLLPKGSVK